jgi:hypothetical protein
MIILIQFIDLNHSEVTSDGFKENIFLMGDIHQITKLNKLDPYLTTSI